MLVSISDFLEKYRKFIPFVLFITFLLVSIPGVNWGVPELWNPDEVVWRADAALSGELVFDETEPDFNYPSLPKYVMYGIGKIVYGFGYSRSTFIIAARVFSALLGAAGAVLVYGLTRIIVVEELPSLLAGLLYIASGVVPANARFAHNDLYLQFFSILCVYFGVKYQFTKSRLWLYASFFSVGLAASSKYTGGSLVLVSLFIFIVMNWKEVYKNWLQTFEMLFIGTVLTFGGYALGTPKALLWMVYYFKRALPAILRYPLYGQNSGTPIGLYGQWKIFQDAVGPFIYYLFIVGFLWLTFKLVLSRMGKTSMQENQSQAVLILVATVVLFDLPFMVSVNYIPRHFIPFVPFLSVLGALFVNDVINLSQIQKYKFAQLGILIVLALGVSYCFLRLISTSLLFLNDARMPASEYIATLPGKNKTIEYTLYPPNVNKKQFEKAHNYPIYFLKYPGETMPTGGKIEYNQGEQGLLDRDVDYLVIDTFTYSRLYNDNVCKTNPVECDFFRKLLAGEISSFHLVKEFTYSLPSYLPNVYISAVNPEIRVYERNR
ncbi:MAG: phospholipid carrier-dependent glycosyltransferase [Anaerolineales bacterium]